MKIATWNVNSLRTRLEHVLRWLAEQSPDILALQEIKQIDSDFPSAAFEAAGYQAVCAGQKTYNGVALITRKPCLDIETVFPGFEDVQKRLLAATVDGVRIINVYVPNGQSVGSEKFAYKLTWLEHFYDYLKNALQQYPKVVVLGDFNIAPEDSDVYNPLAFKDQILCSPQERAAFAKILSLGLVDSFRLFPQAANIYSWWDYRTFAFVGNRGFRIDLLLVNQAFSQNVQRSWVDSVPRAWERPSDHAPAIVECD